MVVARVVEKGDLKVVEWGCWKAALRVDRKDAKKADQWEEKKAEQRVAWRDETMAVLTVAWMAGLWADP